MKTKPQRISGFTLAEITVALVVAGLLLGGLLVSFSAHQEQRRIAATQTLLEEARQTLLGFAALHGRLPCPAGTGGGFEIPEGGPACASPYDGFLPAATLGMSPVDDRGYLLDGWNRPIRYALSADTANDYLPADPEQIRQRWNDGSTPEFLQICSSAAGRTGSGNKALCGSGKYIASQKNGAVAVLFSTGPNGAAAPASPDEQANRDGSRLFVSHLPTPPEAAEGEFDDIALWISASLLYKHMISSGRLP
ncbi:MAG: prepilin-type N-terminal cleavage/methylation domain-containing protein [Betaproteobacteria bacterium]|nr:prepilin-type N-terminal cleavage/methylation domain-containing protein [Betaproteobacteria bacterium]